MVKLGLLDTGLLGSQGAASTQAQTVARLCFVWLWALVSWVAHVESLETEAGSCESSGRFGMRQATA